MTARPLMFTPFTLRDVTLRNRVVIAPMSMYCANDGFPVDFHFNQYGRFALGGAGMVILEQSAITREGRITNGCLGIWSDDQAAALQPVARLRKSQGVAPALQDRKSVV